MVHLDFCDFVQACVYAWVSNRVTAHSVWSMSLCFCSVISPYNIKYEEYIKTQYDID